MAQPAIIQEDRTPEVTHFAECAEWTGVRDDDREAWLEMRHGMVTASDLAAILGENPRRTALSVYVDKVTPRPAPEEIDLDDPRFWGSILEQPILTAVAKHRGWKYMRGGYLLRSRRWPWLGCTLDAEIDRGAGWEPFEGKTTRVPQEWSQEEGNMPGHVVVQTQCQLGVTGASHGLTFALLQGSRPCEVEVDADVEFMAMAAEESQDFLERLKRLDPPPAEAGDSGVLQKLYPEEDGSTIELPPIVVEWTRELQELAARRNEAAKREEALKAKIRQLMGEATFGTLAEQVGGKGRWKLATETREPYTTAGWSGRVLRAVKNPAPPKRGRRRRI